MREINTFDEMIEFIENNDLTQKHIEQLVGACLKVLFVNVPKDKQKVIQVLKDYWSEWKDRPKNCRPIFINAPYLD